MSDEYPFTGTSAETDYTENLNVPLEMDYDFEKHDFKYDGNGQHIIVSGNDALKIWIYKALYDRALSVFGLQLAIRTGGTALHR